VPLPPFSVGLEGLIEDEAAFLHDALDAARDAVDETPLGDCLSEVESRIGQAWDDARSAATAVGEAPEEAEDEQLREQAQRRQKVRGWGRFELGLGGGG
jgi:hypothetical protein